MKIQECYEAFGGDYNDVMNRLPKEELVIKFLRKFAENDIYDKLQQAVVDKDYENVFAHSHNLKGTAANLSITALYKSASALCDSVRNGEVRGDVDALMVDTAAIYEKTMNAIAQLED